MAHPEHREIRTERLILRPLRFGDVDDVFGYANDEEWARYLITVPWPYERRDAVTYIASQVASPPEPGACHLAMELDGRVVGTIGLHARGEGVAELGYGLARAQWGRGLVPEAARTMLSHGFEAYDLQTIYARIDPGNGASRRVAEKLGMTYEGTLRRRIRHRGDWVDHEQWSLLRPEWEAGRTK